MPKRPHKKQKISKVDRVRLLGDEISDDDALKDDEERRLESILFGKKFVPRDKDVDLRTAEDDANNAGAGGSALNNLIDSDLFFFDDALDVPRSESDNESSKNDRGEDDSDGEHQNDSDASSSSASSSSRTSTRSPKKKSPLKSRKPPAWVDPSDPPLVSLAATRLRKLRDAPKEETLSGREYEARLRRQFERINPEPEWAEKARKKRREHQEEQEGVQGAESSINDLLASTEGILRKKGKKVLLSAGNLEIERLRDANLASQSSGNGEARAVTFHPSEHVPVLCVGSADRRVRLFNIDGHTNPLLQTLHIPSLPLTSQSSVVFHPLGSTLLLTGPRPFFYTHDLQKGVTTRHARGLWGVTFNTINDNSSSLKRKNTKGSKSDHDDNRGGSGGGGMEVTAFSPHKGDILAVAGRGGYVHLVDWKSGAGQVIGSLKCGGGGGGVRGLWWTPQSTSGQSELMVLSGDAEVYLWDVGERRCVRRWKDEGGFRGAGRVISGSGSQETSLLAIGSNTGFVNVYGADSFASPETANYTHSPRPLKSIGNLTTAISSISFNHDAQLMAIASKEKKGSMRLIHTSSLTSFSNWPTSSTPLGHVSAVDFSTRSEYLAIGNTRGRVLLYHLKGYGTGW